MVLTFAFVLAAYHEAASVIVQQSVSIAKLNEDNSRLQGIIDSMEPAESDEPSEACEGSSEEPDEPVRGPVCPDDETTPSGVTARSIALANM